jgi:sterol desaturase/sphingolipid hydroxylase (fatty acid hydroxylase superfamily)
MKSHVLKIICYLGALVALGFSAVPLFLFWQQLRSGKADVNQQVYRDYNGLLAVGILLVGALVAAVLLWVASRKKL